MRVEAGPRQSDRYDRLLGYVYTEGGASIDAALIREGLGEAWTRDGQHRDYLVALEATAQAEGAGCLSEEAAPVGSTGGCDPAYPSVCIPPPRAVRDLPERPVLRRTRLIWEIQDLRDNGTDFS